MLRQLLCNGQVYHVLASIELLTVSFNKAGLLKDSTALIVVYSFDQWKVRH